MFIGRTYAKAETPILWRPHVKSWLIGKDSDAGRNWGQEEKGTTEDEMAGLHHRLDGHESEWTPGVGDGQGCLECCNSWLRKESDMTEWLNWTDSFILILGLHRLLVVKNLPFSAGDLSRRFHPFVWKISWRRAWLPTPAFLSGEFHGQRSLTVYSL